MKRILRATLILALIVSTDVFTQAQTILGKHPSDKVLAGFWSQNTNADSTVLGLDANATATFSLSLLPPSIAALTNGVSQTDLNAASNVLSAQIASVSGGGSATNALSAILSTNAATTYTTNALGEVTATLVLTNVPAAIVAGFTGGSATNVFFGSVSLVSTNGVAVTTTATNLNLIEGANVTIQATNVAPGNADVKISASLSGVYQPASAALTNLDIGDASALTNIINGATVSAGNNISVALSQNPNGSTNFTLSTSGNAATNNTETQIFSGPQSISNALNQFTGDYNFINGSGLYDGYIGPYTGPTTPGISIFVTNTTTHLMDDNLDLTTSGLLLNIGAFTGDGNGLTNLVLDGPPLTQVTDVVNGLTVSPTNFFELAPGAANTSGDYLKLTGVQNADGSQQVTNVPAAAGGSSVSATAAWANIAINGSNDFCQMNVNGSYSSSWDNTKAIMFDGTQTITNAAVYYPSGLAAGQTNWWVLATNTVGSAGVDSDFVVVQGSGSAPYDSGTLAITLPAGTWAEWHVTNNVGTLNHTYNTTFTILRQ